ncbi:NADPH-dependent ferric siderophore reductase [Leucobacter luti]|uniref:siderophore-interacting protein n=1 Tax=Leucobacter luti TaxID=340320 RepID=UPI0010450F91|nr:siderophore-interacting protein [Leucobacter luti]MCW2287737.1 NADPH-dependent ferric siderophore reductase [Leucobacter luti]TCK46098.1 NADPH-dependent ferric siderophore reductase [Leucobacter luti]
MAFCEPAEVTQVTRVSPSLIRIRLRAIGSWRWFVEGRGDERIDLAFPHPGESVADASYFNDERAGRIRQDATPPWRHYTVRKVHGDGTEFDVDFVVHDEGIAAAWAQSAAPGQVLGVFLGSSVPRAYYAAPADAEWQLLVADATGLPGLARIVEELPAGAVVQAVVEVPTHEDRQEIASKGDVSWTWVVSSAGTASTLPSVVERATLPRSPGYAWVACEATVSRQVRDVLRRVHAQPRTRHRAIGYWTAGVAGHVEQPREEVA